MINICIPSGSEKFQIGSCLFINGEAGIECPFCGALDTFTYYPDMCYFCGMDTSFIEDIITSLDDRVRFHFERGEL